MLSIIAENRRRRKNRLERKEGKGGEEKKKMFHLTSFYSFMLTLESSNSSSSTCFRFKNATKYARQFLQTRAPATRPKRSRRFIVASPTTSTCRLLCVLLWTTTKRWNQRLTNLSSNVVRRKCRFPEFHFSQKLKMILLLSSGFSRKVILLSGPCHDRLTWKRQKLS